MMNFRQGTVPAKRHLGVMLALVALLLPDAFHTACAQAPDVPIYRQGRKGREEDEKVSVAAKELYDKNQAAHLAQIKDQLKRRSCELTLPALRTNKLDSRDLCLRGRESHLRVGWCYLCGKCAEWHVNLAGGYPLTADGAVATCYHVANPGSEVKEGCLVAADETGAVLPVTEVLAANRYSDACILRVAGGNLKPLPLNTRAYPGDPAYCFSDPLDHRGYFSSGIINRFYTFPARRRFGAPESTAYAPTRLNVTTDWAPGSSGSAVLDQCGNAIGHVSTISGLEGEEETDEGLKPIPGAMMIVFHEAVSARDVLLLIQERN